MAESIGGLVTEKMSAGDASLGDLVSTATRDLSLLIHKEVELAKTEITEEVKRVGVGAGFLGGAGFVGLFAFVFLSVAAALGISEGADLPLWAGFVCIGGGFGGLAGLLGLAGLGKVVKVQGPQRTIRTVRDDIEWARHPTVAPDPDLEDLRARHR